MPTYNATYKSDQMWTSRNRFGKNMSEVIDKTIDAEKDSAWAGSVIHYIELKEVKNAAN